MVLSTSALRREYAPACRDNANNFLPAMKALDAAFKKWKYGPRSGSGCYNCRPITGGTDYSLHAYPDFQAIVFWNGFRVGALALAIDVNPAQNPYGPRLITDMPRGMIDDIYKIRTRSGAQVFRWGGYYATNKDAMHFEIVCSKADLASGIEPKSIPGAVAPLPPKPTGDDLMVRIQPFKGEPTAPGDQPNVIAKYKVISAKDADGQTFDVAAYYLDPNEYASLKYIGMAEVAHSIAINAAILRLCPFHGGPFNNV